MAKALASDAADGVALLCVEDFQGQLALPTLRPGFRAARGKGAAGRQGRQFGHDAFNGWQARFLPPQTRHTCQKSLRVRVLRT